MNWTAVLLATTTAFMTPTPPNLLKHMAAALPAGATARIAAWGNNIPCWDSPASLTAFTRAYQSGDQSTVEMYAADDSFFLEEGVRVKSLGTQGLLGQITRLKILDGDHAGATCYVHSSLRLYGGVKPVRARGPK
ncbi:MAG: hypothetical protein ABR584_10000 [Candidatus Baltobacteraceae bacterium]